MEKDEFYQEMLLLANGRKVLKELEPLVNVSIESDVPTRERLLELYTRHFEVKRADARRRLKRGSRKARWRATVKPPSKAAELDAKYDVLLDERDSSSSFEDNDPGAVFYSADQRRFVTDPSPQPSSHDSDFD